jgi:hypothetical protein
MGYGMASMADYYKKFWEELQAEEVIRVKS